MAATRDLILSAINDSELCARQLLSYSVDSKQWQHDGSPDLTSFSELIKQKDSEIASLLITAEHQALVESETEELRVQCREADQRIFDIQKRLKDAENLLADAIYDAKEKLKSVKQARQRRVSLNELIKYSHKISANYSVNAPPNFAQGDRQRPYPTEFEMQQGMLGCISDLAPPMLVSPSHDKVVESSPQHLIPSPRTTGGPNVFLTPPPVGPLTGVLPGPADTTVQHSTDHLSNSAPSLFPWHMDTHPTGAATQKLPLSSVGPGSDPFAHRLAPGNQGFPTGPVHVSQPTTTGRKRTNRELDNSSDSSSSSSSDE